MKIFFSIESAIIFHPRAASTPAHCIEFYKALGQENFQNGHYDSTNHLTNVASVEPINVVTSGLVPDDILSILEITLREKSIMKKQNKTHQDENSMKENNDRLNRSNFFFKNIATSMTYMDIFISIGTQYPLVQLNAKDNLPKIKYLCVAGNIILT